MPSGFKPPPMPPGMKLPPGKAPIANLPVSQSKPSNLHVNTSSIVNNSIKINPVTQVMASQPSFQTKSDNTKTIV